MFVNILLACNIAMLFWNLLLAFGLLVDRNELLKEWRKRKDDAV